MDYITVKEAAARWQTAERSVQNYCANDKIPGAKRIGRQWLIPFDAELPRDGRTKHAKKHGIRENYRFPVFIYTRFYRDSEELTENEQALLNAQLLHFEGNHVQSIGICNKLLKADLPAYLQAGVYLTLGIDAFLLGLVSRYEEALLKLEQLTDLENTHKDDFRLMQNALWFYIKWNPSDILKIQPSKLSPDAVWYYQTLLMSSFALSSEGMSAYSLRFLESECPVLKKEGMLPTLYFFLVCLGIFNSRGRTQEEKDAFLDEGVRLAVANNWTSNLHRFHSFSPERLEKTVLSHGKAYHRELLRACADSLNNWNIVHLKETGLSYIGIFTPKQFEMLWLISSGYTNKEIALLINSSENAVRKEIRKMMEISKTKNKTQLKQYSKEFLQPSV